MALRTIPSTRKLLYFEYFLSLDSRQVLCEPRIDNVFKKHAMNAAYQSFCTARAVLPNSKPVEHCPVLQVSLVGYKDLKHFHS